eukprot:1880960-Amphidinium_carterae.1
MLLVHAPNFKELPQVRQAFTWGRWVAHHADAPGTLTFLGKEIQVQAEYILLHQNTFVKETKITSSGTT